MASQYRVAALLRTMDLIDQEKLEKLLKEVSPERKKELLEKLARLKHLSGNLDELKQSAAMRALMVRQCFFTGAVLIVLCIFGKET